MFSAANVEILAGWVSWEDHLGSTSIQHRLAQGSLGSSCLRAWCTWFFEGLL